MKLHKHTLVQHPGAVCIQRGDRLIFISFSFKERKDELAGKDHERFTKTVPVEPVGKASSRFLV